VSTIVVARGPYFDRRRPAIIHAMERDCVEQVAQQAYAYVMTNLHSSIRHSTPYYETQVTNDRRGDDRRIHDRGVVYGPWLEGTGSRNRTTRFKGYASFRRATQQADKDVPRLVARVVDKAMRELNA
jgi:hypothetical protein